MLKAETPEEKKMLCEFFNSVPEETALEMAASKEDENPFFLYMRPWRVN